MKASREERLGRSSEGSIGGRNNSSGVRGTRLVTLWSELSAQSKNLSRSSEAVQVELTKQQLHSRKVLIHGVLVGIQCGRGLRND